MDQKKNTWENHATVPWFQSDTKHRPTIGTFALQFRPLHLLDLQKMKITISLDVFEHKSWPHFPLNPI